MYTIDFDQMELNRLMLILTGLLALGIVNYLLADQARRWHGHFWAWFTAFFLVPVISHVLLMFFLRYQMKKTRDLHTARKVLAQPLKSELTPDLEIKPGDSVTPFDGPEPGSDDEIRVLTLEESLESLGDKRDVRLDEFIARDQWRMADGFARRWRELAVKKEQPDIVEIYDTYIEIIEPHITV